MVRSEDPLANDPAAQEFGLVKVRDLGSGAFGNVMLYRRMKPYPEEIAIKFIERHSNVDYTLIAREVRSHALLNHPHVIQFKRLGLTADGRYVYMMMEFADRGDLYNYLAAHQRFSEDDARWFFQQLIIGLDYCHKRGVVNRDLKLENILLGKIPEASPAPPGALDRPGNLHCKVADFGLCKKTMQSGLKSCVGTMYYMAPEVLLACPGRPYDAGADIWSAGVLLYVLLCRDYPFGVLPERHTAEQRDTVLQNILTAKANWQKLEANGVSPDCRDLLSKILVPDAAKRATLADIMAHPWFADGLPEGLQEFNDMQLTYPPSCEQTQEELEAVLARMLQAPSGAAARAGSGALQGNSSAAKQQELNELIDLQLDEYADEHPWEFDG